jgi:hypothetical protein
MFLIYKNLGKEIFLKTLETDKNYEDDAHIIEDIDQEL